MKIDQFAKIIFGVSVIVGFWAIYQIFAEQKYFQGGILLAYVGVVIVGTSGLLRPSTGSGRMDEMVLPSPQSSPTRGEGEEIILNIIREKGRAKREDLLPATGLSRSSLGRLLDEMEAEGKIVQVGERKGSFYTLKQP